MLAGHRPFGGSTTVETAAAILQEDPEPISATSPSVPETIASVVAKCLEKRPEDRFSSTHDLSLTLGAMESATATPPRHQKSNIDRRWPHILVVVIAAVIGLLVILPPNALVDRLTGTTETPPIRSIAILPLENLTGDPEQAYFVDGLHEELIATFAQISAFDKVIARTSVMGFRDSDTPIREIGKQLGVEAVLVGSVRRSGDTVRATVQLIDARTESHLWTESYERDLTDILALQSEVARAVVGEVRITLTPDERDRLAVSRQVVEEAYEAFLWGSHLLALGPVQSEASLLKAIAFFETALEADPDYAPAHAGLSMALSWLGVRYRPPAEVMPKANRAALRASELDDTLVDAHVNLGRIKMYWEWDWNGAKSEISLARELSPNDPDSVREDAFLHVISGRLEEAVALQERVVQLDPLAPRAREELGRIYWFARRYDDGIRHLQETAELFPNRAAPHLFLCWIFQSKGQWTQALAAVEKSGELHPAPEDDPLHLATLVFSQGAAGNTEEASEILERLLALRSRSYVSPIFFVYGYIGVGDVDRSIEWLERAYEARHQHVTVLEQLPSFDPLRDDPRFQDIVRRMNFPEN
jgi:TolB-like protein